MNFVCNLDPKFKKEDYIFSAEKAAEMITEKTNLFVFHFGKYKDMTVMVCKGENEEGFVNIHTSRRSKRIDNVYHVGLGAPLREELERLWVYQDLRIDRFPKKE